MIVVLVVVLVRLVGSEKFITERKLPKRAHSIAKTSGIFTNEYLIKSHSTTSAENLDGNYQNSSWYPHACF